MRDDHVREFKTDCQVDGGLVVADRATLNALSDADLFSLMVALDDQGRTELALDYPGESWQHVYDRETQRLKERCRAGELWFANLGPGRFWGSVEVAQVVGTPMPEVLASSGGSPAGHQASLGGRESSLEARREERRPMEC